MDQVHVVRYKVLVEGRTQRAVARELGDALVQTSLWRETRSIAVSIFGTAGQSQEGCAVSEIGPAAQAAGRMVSSRRGA
jgi:hypothetical protein